MAAPIVGWITSLVTRGGVKALDSAVSQATPLVARIQSQIRTAMSNQASALRTARGYEGVSFKVDELIYSQLRQNQVSEVALRVARGMTLQEAAREVVAPAISLVTRTARLTGLDAIETGRRIATNERSRQRGLSDPQKQMQSAIRSDRGYGDGYAQKHGYAWFEYDEEWDEDDVAALTSPVQQENLIAENADRITESPLVIAYRRDSGLRTNMIATMRQHGMPDVAANFMIDVLMDMSPAQLAAWAKNNPNAKDTYMDLGYGLGGGGLTASSFKRTAQSMGATTQQLQRHLSHLTQAYDKIHIDDNGNIDRGKSDFKSSSELWDIMVNIAKR